MDFLEYLALCLTGCFSVAVLGARRPHVGPWNFVVFGLLAVMLLPWLEQGFLGIVTLDAIRWVFLVTTIGLGVVNYFPTGNGLAACLLIFVGAVKGTIRFEPWKLLDAPWPLLLFLLTVLLFLILLAVWQKFFAHPQWRNPEIPPFDRVWLRFRDRYGLFWALRVREQFNIAAQNAGWPVHLAWGGLQVDEGEVRPEMVETFKALLKRFEAPEAEPAGLEDSPRGVGD